MQSRRDFLKKAAMLAGATGFAAGLPESVQKAFAIAPDPGTTWEDAEHIVILMQENRSFDHAFGTLQGVRGFNDPRALRQANNNSIFLQTNKAGDTYAPWRLDIRDTKITWMGSIPHSRNSQVDAWNFGHHNTWIDSKRSGNKDYHDVPITMGHYTREDIPFYFALADAFTVCDQNYCSVMSSTTPNRSVFMTGTIRDEQKADSAVYMRNQEFHSGLKWKTFPERLTDAGVSWHIYQNDVNIADLNPEEHEWLGNVGNMAEHFAVYNLNKTGAGHKKMVEQIEATKAEIAEIEAKPIDAGMAEDRKALLDQKHEHLAALEEQLRGGSDLASLPAREQELHRRAFVTNVNDPHYHSLEELSFEDDGKTVSMNVPKGDVLYQFRKDVAEGKLPAVSWMVPPGKFSDHPSHPWYGAWYLSEVVDILTNNPEVWKKTIFILTYDENDGYFDHAPSYVAADPKNKLSGRASNGIDTALEYSYAPDELAQDVKPKEARSGPIGLGFRVPMVIASPWSRGGWVNSELFDHSSTLQFLETFVERKYGKQVRETNVSEFRRTICGDLTSCFRAADITTSKLPFLDRDPFLEGIQRARYKEVPSNFQKLTAEQISLYNEDATKLVNSSRQEPGIRPANGLPYEMYCEGDLRADGKSFALAMRAGNSVHGAASAGVPFNVYIRNTAQKAAVAEHGPNNANMLVATYAVKAGDTMQESIPMQAFADGKYAIDVHGPNGFYREFRGSATPSPIVVRCVYERNGSDLTGNVVAHVKNTSAHPLKVVVSDLSYKGAPVSKEILGNSEAMIPVSAAKVHGWYDFAVRAEGSEASVRYAGHVETKRSSFTDPFMGRVTV